VKGIATEAAPAGEWKGIAAAFNSRMAGQASHNAWSEILQQIDAFRVG
jgi:hypothetical protein